MQAAGTGIIISSSGLVLTNNHVIADSTSLQVENSADGSTHTAKVLGYDVADDVALVQIQNVSGLTPAPLGNSSNLSVGDAVVALGNAGGQGGSPSVVTGSVTGLNQQITASDQDGSNPETLHHLVETDANIQPGDSGGPLTDSNGQVVGMDAAASSNNGGSGFAGQSTNQGYAIPIEDALAIAKNIASGDGGTNIHVGASRGVLGVEVQADSTTNGFGNSSNNGQGSGAVVSGVQSGSAAEAAGIAQGDVITAVDGTSVGSVIRSHPCHERSLTRRQSQRHLDRLVGHQPARLHPTRVGSPRLTPITGGVTSALTTTSAPSHRLGASRASAAA